MKKYLFLSIAFLIFNILFSQQHYASDALIVKFKKKPVSYKNQNIDLKKLNSEFNLKKTKKLDGDKTYLFQFEKKININDALIKYKKTGLFEYVEPNYKCFGAGKKGVIDVFPNDVYFNRQWYLYNDGSFSLSPAIADADIDMELAWDLEQGNSNIIVAVLDTGTKLNHPELVNRIWHNTNEIINNSDQDMNGYIDDTDGWDFVNSDNQPVDDAGHGTNVMGIIGADANNNLGYAGMDWNCKLMTCKVLDNNNSGYYSWMIEAIHYAVDNGAKVINMSIGGSSYSNTLEDAINYAYNNNVTIVACMMNFNNQVTYYPAGFEHTIAVGSTDANDKRSNPFFWSVTSGSNYGDHIDVVAPGNYIYGLSNTSDTDFNTYWGGTSQATPQVTALCSLLLAQDASRTPDDLKSIIQNTAEDQVGDPVEDVNGFDIYYGYGRINAYNALNTINLSVHDATQSDFKVYPNLVNDVITVKGKNLDKKTLFIYDILGREIYFKELNNSTQINLQNLKKGIYFLTLKDVFNNRIFTKKIIKI